MTLEVQGDLRALLDELRHQQSGRLTLALNRAWAEEAARRVRQNVGGGPGTAYLRMRSGSTRNSVQTTANSQGATVSASGPGISLQEDGGTITAKRGKWLTFRVYRPSDGPVATGPWRRVRQVRIRAKHPVRDAAMQALDTLGPHLDAILGGLS